MPKRASESESGDVSSGSLLLRCYANGNLKGKVSPDRAEDYEYDGFSRKVFRTEDYWHPEEGEKE